MIKVQFTVYLQCMNCIAVSGYGGVQVLMVVYLLRSSDTVACLKANILAANEKPNVTALVGESACMTVNCWHCYEYRSPWV
jgi:hypothetical protein